MLNGRRRSACFHHNGWLCPRDLSAVATLSARHPAQRAIAVAISFFVKRFGRLHNDPVPRAPTAGVRKAPMNEIARGGATRVRRAVREFRKDVDADDGGCNVVRRVDAARNLSVPAQILSK